MSARISSALRQRIAEFSKFRCSYCLTPQRIIGPLLEIDHIVPESRNGTNEENNLCLACPLCNSHKADRIEWLDPETQIVTLLFNPREQNWNDHFEWVDDGAMIRGKTSTGRATVVALNVNDPASVAARRLWIMVGWHPPKN